MWPTGSFVVRMPIKKLSTGTVATKTVPVNAYAFRAYREPAPEASRKITRQSSKPNVVTQKRRHSLDSGYDSDDHFTKSSFNPAPSQAERERAKKEVIRDMAQILAVASNTAAGPKYTVTAEILGNAFQMLIDSGSQVNIVPADSCPREILAALLPLSISISAYNGSAVNILGTFKTDITIGKIVIKETLIHVTDNKYRPILGTPALSSLSLDFKNSSISNGQAQVRMFSPDFNVTAENFNLQSKPKKLPRRNFKVYSTKRFVIPAKSEAVVQIQIEKGFADYGLFATEPETTLITGCRVAKSLSCFTKQTPTGIVRILNPSPNPIQISKRQPIVTVAAVDALAANSCNRRRNVTEDIKIGAVPDAERGKILKLLHDYSDVFATDDSPLGQAKNVEFDVDTGKSTPVAQQKYRTPYFLRAEMRRIIDKNIQNGLMEPCSSPWAAPTLLVRKPNGKWRLVCDYRRLNSVTTADSYPLPEIMDCVNELGESKFFTTTDLYSGFHQVPTTAEAKKKLAVTTDFGQFTWLRLPMGAKNSPAVFSG